MTEFISLFQAAIVFGTIIIYGAIGEILTEKSGNLNLGVPGVMYLGGIAGLTGVFFYENSVANPNVIVCVLIAIVCAFIAAMLGGLIFSFLTITLMKLAGGVGQISVATTSAAFRATQSWTDGWGIVDKLFLSYGFMVYLAIILALLLGWFINKTSIGLNLRAVGENPATADAAGINVAKYKYLATCIGSGISGLGGLYYVMDYTKGTWANDGAIEALGWLAVALVIFATWKPKRAIWGAYLFGALYWLYFYIPGLNRSSQEIFKMLPYLATLFVLIMVALRKKREDQPPHSLGAAYFREER